MFGIVYSGNEKYVRIFQQFDWTGDSGHCSVDHWKQAHITKTYKNLHIDLWSSQS